MGSYVTNSPPGSSQWLVLKEQSLPDLVFANSSGEVPRFGDLEGLNQTRIGVFCSSVQADSTCTEFATLRETGWYYDSSNELLYIHYVGGDAVKISVLLLPGGTVITTTTMPMANETETVTITVSSP